MYGLVIKTKYDGGSDDGMYYFTINGAETFIPGNDPCQLYRELYYTYKRPVKQLEFNPNKPLSEVVLKLVEWARVIGTTLPIEFSFPEGYLKMLEKASTPSRFCAGELLVPFERNTLVAMMYILQENFEPDTIEELSGLEIVAQEEADKALDNINDTLMLS
jgi:hypothetical protein